MGAWSDPSQCLHQPFTPPLSRVHSNLFFLSLCLSLSLSVVDCYDVHHHYLLLVLLLLFRSSTLEDSIKQYEQDLARKLYQSRQRAPAPGARPAQVSSPVQSHVSRTPGSGSQSRCAQPLPLQLHVPQSLSVFLPHIAAISAAALGVGRNAPPSCCSVLALIAPWFCRLMAVI